MTIERDKEMFIATYSAERARELAGVGLDAEVREVETREDGKTVYAVTVETKVSTMQRFTEIRPKLDAEDSEPSLREIIQHYYRSHDIVPENATAYTEAYIREWLKLEDDLELSCP